MTSRDVARAAVTPLKQAHLDKRKADQARRAGHWKKQQATDARKNANRQMGVMTKKHSKVMKKRTVYTKQKAPKPQRAMKAMTVMKRSG